MTRLFAEVSYAASTLHSRLGGEYTYPHEACEMTLAHDERDQTEGGILV